MLGQRGKDGKSSFGKLTGYGSYKCKPGDVPYESNSSLTRRGDCDSARGLDEVLFICDSFVPGDRDDV